MKIKVGDNVVVTRGTSRGKTGKVLKIVHARNQVVVEGVHIVKRHVRSRVPGKKGEIVKVTRPISASNVKFICPETKRGTRIGYKIVDGEKKRISKKSGKAIS
ncbi:MAG: 50S ribosomal protein L24 [Parcubacteria group bacterium GW2011_GWA2_47_8]|nr:ribosomal protein L24 [uncultured bacterium]KKU82748.1 MAG: 50S ribosomal protein L24 [Parcubacteria group bacterium GW2011_GWA2_47_8]OHB20414.1 MAG: 50S ribosomal protein L24 [Parcubacteria group bacterium RIFCSPHIGHO2_01_FULL_47_10b]